MEQQGGRSSQPLTNQQIAGEMIGFIAGPCIESITEENIRLATDLELIDDATQNGIENYMSVRSVIDILTDGKEVDKLVRDVPLTSRFHNSYSAVQELVKSLGHWTAEQFFSPQDSMARAFDILAQRRRENLILLGESLDG